MPQPTLPPDATQSITIHVTNLTAEQARFLSEVIYLFTDPAKDEQRRLLQDHRAQLTYGTGGYMNFSEKFGGN
jgi:hypothetical protein